ncbi:MULTISPECIES: hypothetical protein [Streptomyces]|jgi:hypothetical protein|uniref:Uncharacterized protein n=1 Tax=Streptomyces sp. 900129855 TaxID=3155129 RepID=A0ABV2ZB14_9ACTN
MTCPPDAFRSGGHVIASEPCVTPSDDWTIGTSSGTRRLAVHEANGACLRLLGGRLPQPLQLFVPVSGTLYGLPGGDGTLAGTYLAHRARHLPPAAALDRAVQAASQHTAHMPLTLPAPPRAPS